MADSNYDPILLSVIIDALDGMRATPGLHEVRNVKDLMMIIRPAWVDLEQTIGSRKPVGLRTIADKMLAAGSRLIVSAYKLKRMQDDEDQKVRESVRPEPVSRKGR